MDYSQDADWWEQYSWALFKAMSHMLCIGYGRADFQSQSSKGLAGGKIFLLIHTVGALYFIPLGHIRICTIIQSIP